MFDAAHKADNGVTVQYIDGGVQYTHNGKTLEFVGDYEEGECGVHGGVSGTYTRGDDDITHVQLSDGRTFTISDEEEQEELALLLLSE